MVRRRQLGMTVLVLAMLFGVSAPAWATVIDFDGLSDLDTVTTQFSGLTFSNATVLTAGASLNEFEFPPHSGANVVFDDGGAITIVFAAPQASVSGFFTYTVPIILTAFDATNAVVGSDDSDFGSNLALSGDLGSSPNELLGVAFPGGIARVTIQGDGLGSSFTFDDLSFQAAETAVPEPATILLLGSGLAGAAAWRARRRYS